MWPAARPPRGALGWTQHFYGRMHKVVGSCCAATSIIGGSAYLLSRAASPQPKKAAAAAAARDTMMSGASVIHGSAGWNAPTGPTPHQFASVWCLMPHPEKAHKGGEDAAFGTPNAVGVADGVGGWASRGVDPGLYSKGLMRSAEKQALAKPAPHTPTPTELLRAAYDDVEQQQVLGSTTAIVVTLESMAKDKASIHVANLGDSGVMLVRPSAPPGRPSQKVFRSVEQQHSFNFPFQLGGGGGDRPEMADRHTIEVIENDLIGDSRDQFSMTQSIHGFNCSTIEMDSSLLICH